MSELAGRYRLGEVLGTGGTSTVYRAQDAALGVERAVKVLRGDGGGIDAQRARLRSEARAMARVTHPNILRVYDVGTADGQDYFVMDLAEGGSLQDRVDTDGPLPPVVACRYALQILGALAAAHDAGVIHRDVKPQNVLLDRDGVALLADFGIALLSDGRESRHTSVGVAMGSMTYMPPEQRLDARGVGVGADIYATGATLYAILTGASPVDLFLAASGSARWDDVPAVLCPMLQRATRLAPGERYPSARHMAAAVLAAMAQLPPEPAPSPKDDAAWVWVRDRVLASLSGPAVDIEATPVPVGPKPVRGRGGGASPTMHAVVASPATLRRNAALGVLGILLVLSLVVGAASWLNRMVDPSRGVAGRPVAPTTVGASVRDAAALGTAATTGEGASANPATVTSPPETPRATESAAPAEASTSTGRSPRRPARPATATSGDVPQISPIGAWSGSFNGRTSQFQLTGTDDALRGTVTVTFQGNAVVSEVEGRYDRATRIVDLTDVAHTADSGRYLARLTDEPALDGTFKAAETGQVVRFRMKPVR